MGWFSSACSWVSKTVRTVTRTVTRVAQSVGNTIRRGWEGVKNVATSVYSGIKKVVSYVEKGYEYISNKVKQANDWFWNTSFGKGITNVKNFIMNKTPLGSFIKWGRDKLSSASKWFFEETWLGRTVTKGI